MNGWIRSSSIRSTYLPTISKVKVTICSRSPSASPNSYFSRSRRRSSSSSNWCPTRWSSTTHWTAHTINPNCFAVRTSLVHSPCFRLAPCTKVRGRSFHCSFERISGDRDYMSLHVHWASFEHILSIFWTFYLWTSKARLPLFGNTSAPFWNDRFSWNDRPYTRL